MQTLRYSFVLALITLSQASAQIAATPVPHTPPRDQGAVGFCWSYTLNGLLESEALKSGKTVTLSPEYIGFYHMYDHLKENIGKFRFWARKKEPKSKFDKKLWELARVEAAKQVMGFLGQSPSEGAPNLTEPFTLLAKYGVVPEAIFNTKIGKDQSGMEKRVLNHFLDKLMLKSTVDDFAAHPEKIHAELAKVFGITPPMPDAPFTYEGREYSALSFVKDYLSFDSSQYQEVKVTRSNQSRIYPQILKSLDDGNSVPLGYIIFGDQFEEAKNTGVFDSANCKNQTCSKPAGGHAVLGVNYTSHSLIIKNSWGPTGLDVMGTASSDPAAKGYYAITTAYLDNPFRLTTTEKPSEKNPDPQPKPVLNDSAQGYTVVLKKQYLN